MPKPAQQSKPARPPKCAQVRPMQCPRPPPRPLRAKLVACGRGGRPSVPFGVHRKYSDFVKKPVLFAVGTHRRGIRVRILITLPIGRAGARVVVWGVPHTPKMGSRRREIGNLLREYFRSCSTQKPRYQCYFAECITISTNGRRPVRPGYLKLDLW